MTVIQRMMVTSLALVAASFFAIFTIDPPRSIADWGATAQAGSAVLGGRKVTCRFGKVVYNDKLPDLGMAAKGTIWLNRKLLRKHPPAFQQFVFLHECAHQYIWDEAGADCWAVKRGVYRGLFNSSHIKQICRIMKNWKGGIWHNAGPARCDAINQCFKEVKNRSKKAKRRAGVSKKP